tara:strand:+ start:7537 stop:8292 length:756 start_codon:yes stop_codon:yes gene_type:complete
MNWFVILKEDKVLPKMREFQFAGERKNKPEVEDDRCRKKLKEKFLRLKERNESLETYGGKSGNYFRWSKGKEKGFEGEIHTQLAGHGGDTGYVNIKDHQSIDRLVEIFDKVSEEMCCGILEAIQEMVVEGRNWYTTQIKEGSRKGFFPSGDMMDFPMWDKNVSIPDEYGFDETANISLHSGFWLSNSLYFSLSLHRKDESGMQMQYGYRFSLEYDVTGWEGRSVGTVDEDVDIRFRQNLIIFMNFILTMKD